MKSMTDKQVPSILIVDDVPDNLQVLSDILHREGFRVRPVISGAMALRTIEAALPDLILADIKMPGMDGYELCRRLKASDTTRDIPVIFISALGETKDKVQAFETGGVDYITKPFQSAEVVARVRTHLAMTKMRVSLKQMNSELEESNKELEAFSYSVSHDLRAPLRAIEGFAAVAMEQPGVQSDVEARHLLGLVRTNAKKMLRLIDDLLTFSRSSRSELRFDWLDMAEMARAAFEEVAPAPSAREKIDFRIGELPAVRGDAALLKQVWLNLLSNAVKFSRDRETPVVEVGAAFEGDTVVYHVRDNGVGFDMAHAERLFGVFQRLHGASEFEGTGVGLALVHRIISRHGGRVAAKGGPGEGATFSFSFPVSSARGR